MNWEDTKRPFIRGHIFFVIGLTMVLIVAYLSKSNAQ
jgi:hypothetical protein